MKIKRYLQLTLAPVLLSTSLSLLAGSLNSPAAPTDASSAMYTLEDIWNRLDGTTAPALSGGFTEPTSGPGATGYTLTDIYNKIPSCIPNSSANPIFVDNGDGTVTDNRTCLMWLKDASCIGQRAWADVDASTEVVILINAATCDGYTANTYTDWRLPTIQELQSLVHYGYFGPAMSNKTGAEKWGTNSANDAFSAVKTTRYWSSTTHAGYTSDAWHVYLYHGHVSYDDKALTGYVWPVRGSQ